MRRILVCREYPPAPGGGIGTYALHAAHALAAAGDIVHVVTQRWSGAERPVERSVQGRLVVHRLPVDRPALLPGSRPHPALAGEAAALFDRDGPAAAFAWQAADLVESLVEREEISLIEGSEYEAPLWFLQARRAHGLGPAARPPCVVHLHSPTELIALANGVDAARAAALAQAHREEASLRAADALICPSHYLADQVTAHYRLAPAEAPGVVPYPIGDTDSLDRDPTTWRDGAVLFLGRLELRKGILEWVAAAAMLAETDPSLRFEFVGSDHVDAQLGGSGNVDALIPRAHRRQFRFHEHRDRRDLVELLAKARLVVVPSRWENFPYTCIEAMASGAPVVVAPTGGMAEMLDHGVSGWIARSQRPADLAAATREALASGPEALARAGAAAARAIRERCAVDRVVAGHRAFATRLPSAGRQPPRELFPTVTIPPVGPRDWDARWSEPGPGAIDRAIALGQGVRRAIARPTRTVRLLARHLGWRPSEHRP
jgi:glycosyltransferase involved in cell wall biosynthesis